MSEAPTLSVAELRRLGRYRHRPGLIHCPLWINEKRCEARIATAELFKKHVKVHGERIQKTPDELVKWGDFKFISRATPIEWTDSEDLQEQLAFLASGLADDQCPIKGCSRPAISSKGDYHFQTYHAGETFTEDRLRPLPGPSKRKLEEVSPLPQGSTPTYEIIAPPVSKFMGGSRGPRLADMREPIQYTPDQSAPFIPNPARQRQVSYSYLSSDIFPLNPLDGEELEDDASTQIFSPVSTPARSATASAAGQSKLLMPSERVRGRHRSHSVMSDRSAGPGSPLKMLSQPARGLSSVAPSLPSVSETGRVQPSRSTPVPRSRLAKRYARTHIICNSPPPDIPDPIPSANEEGATPLQIRKVDHRFTVKEIPLPMDYISDRYEESVERNRVKQEQDSVEKADVMDEGESMGEGKDSKDGSALGPPADIPSTRNSAAASSASSVRDSKPELESSRRPGTSNDTVTDKDIKRMKYDADVFKRAAHAYAVEKTGAVYGYDFLAHREAFMDFHRSKLAESAGSV